jgi:hypothetical protein
MTVCVDYRIANTLVTLVQILLFFEYGHMTDIERESIAGSHPTPSDLRVIERPEILLPKYSIFQRPPTPTSRNVHNDTHASCMFLSRCFWRISY